MVMEATVPVSVTCVQVAPEVSQMISLESNIDFNAIIAKLVQIVPIKDRSSFFITYKNVFYGKDMITCMINSGISGSVTEAAILGNLLIHNGYISSATQEQEFKNDGSFYSFQTDGTGATHGHGKNRQVNGQNVSLWKHFADSIGKNVFQAGGSGDISYIAALPKQETGAKLGEREEELLRENLIPLVDKHNVKLLDNVHPSAWIQPHEKSVPYNLLVIGAGAGGLVSSIGANMMGGTVALVESQFLGGDCTNFGCVPSKALIKSAHVAKLINTSSDYGVEIGGHVQVNFPKVMERMRRIRAQISDFEAAERLSKLGIDVFMGRAVFDSPNSVMVGDRRILFRKCILCTGASAHVPNYPGLNSIPFITNEGLFNLTSLPPSMIVLGAGPVGMEMAQVFARFGTKVTVIDRGERILHKEDPDAAQLVQEAMIRDGVRFVHHASIVDIAKGKEHQDETAVQVRVSINGVESILTAVVLFVATGRRPRVQNMGLDVAGVSANEMTGIQVDDNMRTSNRNIFAAGDCCSRYQFTHMADWMARICIKNALFFGADKFSKLIVPWCTFTDPEIAHVGLYAADLEKKNIPYETFMRHFSDIDRAVCEGTGADGSVTGFVKIHVKKDTDIIVGATIVGEGAGDMISEVTVAMHAGMGLNKLSSVIHPYPTRADCIRQVGDHYKEVKMSDSMRGILRAILAFS